MAKTVEEVFEDFKGRQAGLIKALTTDINEFYQQCDPGKENLCLYGLPNGTWEVKLPVEEVPAELPGDGILEPDWLARVAVHSDSCLISLAFYFGARLGFVKNERHQLFEMINELPTVSEVVSEADKKTRDNDICGACGNNYATDEFWICCDICETWYHGKCVEITPAKSQHITQFKCFNCLNKCR